MALVLKRILASTPRLEPSADVLLSVNTTMAAPPSKAPTILNIDIDTCFPPPKPLLDTLLSLGLDQSRAKQTSSIFMKHALQCRTLCIEKHQYISSQLSDVEQTLLPRAINALQQVYLRNIKQLEEKCTRPVRKWAEENRDSEQSHPFTHKNLLDYSFSLNPLPSRAGKALLAKKLGMTYHQVDIWFQNQRRRSRIGFDEKGGPIYKPCKLTPEEREACAALLRQEAHSRCYPNLYEVIPIPAPKDARSIPFDGLVSQNSQPTAASNPLDVFIPATENLEVSDTFAHLEWWYRRPSSSKLPSPRLTLSELIRCFMKLSIKEEGDCETSPIWVNPFIVPRRYFVQPRRLSCSSIRSPCNFRIVRATNACPHPQFAPPTPSTRNLLIKPQTAPSVLGKRKLIQSCLSGPGDTLRNMCVGSTLDPFPASINSSVKRTRTGHHHYTPKLHVDTLSYGALPETPKATSPVVRSTPSTASPPPITPVPHRSPSFISVRPFNRRTSTASITSIISSASSTSSPAPSTNITSSRESSTAPSTPDWNARKVNLNDKHWAPFGLTPAESTPELNLLATVAGSPLGKHDFDPMAFGNWLSGSAYHAKP